MPQFHKNNQQWESLALKEQVANIGSEVLRTIKWRGKNTEYSQLAFHRALELIDMTIGDRKNLSRLKEIVRLRELIIDYIYGNNLYQSSDLLWERYFLPFNYYARINR